MTDEGGGVAGWMGGRVDGWQGGGGAASTSKGAMENMLHCRPETHDDLITKSALEPDAPTVKPFASLSAGRLMWCGVCK